MCVYLTPAGAVEPAPWVTEPGLTPENRVYGLGNARGSVLVHAKSFDGLQRGVIVVESLWPNGAFIEGIGINLLIGADAVRPRGGAAFHDTAIWLKSA